MEKLKVAVFIGVDNAFLFLTIKISELILYAMVNIRFIAKLRPVLTFKTQASQS